MDPQTIRRNVLGFGDAGASSQARTGRNGREVADTVRAIVQRVLQAPEAHDRANEHRGETEREQSVSDGLAAGEFGSGPILINVNPLLVAGCFRKGVDTSLRDLDPFADAHLGADGRLDVVESVEYPHDRRLRVRFSCAERDPESKARLRSPP